MFYEFYAIDKGGKMPLSIKSGQECFADKQDIVERVDNAEALNNLGIIKLVISIYPDRWHIEQVAGYVRETGLYCKNC